MAIIHRPTEEIIHTCDLIDEGISLFLESMRNKSIGTYEFEVDCLINITHSIRVLESIVELARKDLVYIQSGLILSRTIFEILVKVSWVLHPSDQFENESRYVSLLNTECEFLEKWIKELTSLGTSDLEKQTKAHQGFLTFKDNLSKLLNEKGYSIKRLPNVREILKTLNEERKYLYYILLSQYTHLTHYAGSIYRKNLGAEKELTEQPQPDRWKLVFAVSWPVFELATELYIYTIGQQDILYTPQFKEKIRNSLLKIE